nr:hypothetical protein GCM10020093_028050 [Planobispora longispora]
MTAVAAGPAELLRRLCDATSARLAGAELRERVARIRADLDAPLRVAVAARSAAGSPPW